MGKKIASSVLLLVLVAAGVWYAVSHNGVQKAAADKVSVVASFYPLYDFAQRVGGSRVFVTNATPAGAEPHDFEPSPKTLADAQQSAVFLYNGGTLEPWVNGFLHDYNGVTVKASNGIALQTAAGTNGGQMVRDPHFWLDPVSAQQIVNNIRDGLSRADPSHAAYYAKNAAAYNAKLGVLARDFQTGLSQCRIRTVITSHASLGYVAARYNLDVAAIAGLSPDQEPSAAKLAELAQLMRSKQITYVFFESLVSPRLAGTLAAETGATTLVFNPLEGLTAADQKQGRDYLSVQAQNLANLRTAMACR